MSDLLQQYDQAKERARAAQKALMEAEDECARLADAIRESLSGKGTKPVKAPKPVKAAPTIKGPMLPPGKALRDVADAIAAIGHSASTKELAEHLGVSEKTMSVRIMRALEKDLIVRVARGLVGLPEKTA